MKTAAFITILTTVMSVFVKLVGLPDQIRSNYRRKTTDGLSNWFMICTLLSYMMWVVHGVQVHDEALIIGQGLGVIATSAIIYQMFIYRKNKKLNAKPVMLWMSALLSKHTDIASEKVNKA